MVGLDQDLGSVRVKKITQYKVQVPGKEQQSEKVMVVVVLVLGLCVNWVKHTSPPFLMVFNKHYCLKGLVQ